MIKLKTMIGKYALTCVDTNGIVKCISLFDDLETLHTNQQVYSISGMYVDYIKIDDIDNEFVIMNIENNDIIVSSENLEELMRYAKSNDIDLTSVKYGIKHNESYNVDISNANKSIELVMLPYISYLSAVIGEDFYRDDIFEDFKYVSYEFDTDFNEVKLTISTYMDSTLHEFLSDENMLKMFNNPVYELFKYNNKCNSFIVKLSDGYLYHLHFEYMKTYNDCGIDYNVYRFRIIDKSSQIYNN